MSLKLCQYFKPISISLSPNTEKDDLFLALKLLFQPWHWKVAKNKIAIHLLEEKFKEYLGVKEAISFNSGRSALLAILKSLDLKEEDEILLQTFTCNAVVNPIIWAGLKPVYVDCDDKSFNIDIEDLKRKISQKSKAVIVQHTFGLPADLSEILEVCQKNNLILIEDCAHSLGAEYQGKKIGTFGKASFFSFSRDKIISSVYGGMAVANDEDLAKKIKEFQEKIDYPSYFWIFQQLLHPILINYLILPTYSIFGKYLLIFLQWFQILSKAIHQKEKRGEKPSYFPKRLPNALAVLVLNQLKKIERFNEHRKKIAEFYQKELKKIGLFELPLVATDRKQVFLRFTLKHPKAHQIIKKAWRKNLLIGDWYTTPVAPDDTNLDKIGYINGSCPKAEKLAHQTFNLPTHINISLNETERVINFLKEYGRD